jgi:ADP-ribosylglycohydrolase
LVRHAFGTALLLAALCGAARAQIVLDEATYRDKVYACWLGKSIGGTLGIPAEGKQEPQHLTFYEPVPTEPGANDDLDLQLLWLKALEERGPGITSRDLAEYWQSFVPVDWNEYGVGKANVRDGWEPPLSGHYRNKRWRDSNGAWIRSEIWACLAPGMPALAAHYAIQDASVDHGMSEGTYAEVFTAVVESAAFVEQDTDKLLALGLASIPSDCAVAVSVRSAMDSYAKGLDLYAAREAVIEASKSTGWFMAPQNVAFTVLGWLYGEGDFAKSICAAVNCGDDTDCTGATMGSLWGILHGSSAIPAEWRAPVGEGIRTVAVLPEVAPADLSALTDRTVEAAQVVLHAAHAPVQIGAIAVAGDARPLLEAGVAEVAKRWPASPFVLTRQLVCLNVTLDYLTEPEVAGTEPHEIRVTLENRDPKPVRARVTWRSSDGLTAAAGTEDQVTELAAHESKQLSLVLSCPAEPSGVLRGEVQVSPLQRIESCVIPVSLAVTETIHPQDLALASLGVKATSDSEYDKQLGCTAKINDGEFVVGDDFESVRWHSALSAHPHWAALELPEAKTVGRAILHFADPQGRPVDFEGQMSGDGRNWTTLFAHEGDPGSQRLEVEFAPSDLRFFRLFIKRSASALYPGAAQLSEIELLPPK